MLLPSFYKDVSHGWTPMAGMHALLLMNLRKITRFFSVSEMTRNSVSGKVWMKYLNVIPVLRELHWVLIRNLEGAVMSASMHRRVLQEWLRTSTLPKMDSIKILN